MERRRDIDGLRAIAVMPVVLYHAGASIAPGGFVGVDVFFVISGFLITGIIRDELQRRSFSLLNFYERRARRILPALFFMLAASFLAGWIIMRPSLFADYARSVGATTLFSSNFWFWRTARHGYFDDSIDFLPLLHTWSLAVEEQFYLIFPLLLMALSRLQRGAVAAIGAGSLASLALAVIAVALWPHAAFYLAPTRAWELGAGAMLALLPIANLGPRWRRELLAFAGLAAILGSVVLYNDATPFPGLAAIPPCVGAAALLVAGAQGKNATSSLLSWAPLVGIGAISYSLYLWHWPILSFLRIRFQTTDLSPLAAAAGVGAALAMAALSWAIVERPFRDRAFLRRRQVFALSGASMAAALCAAAAVWIGAGFPSRLPAAALAAAAGANDINPSRPDCLGRFPEASLCSLGAARSGGADFLLWGDSHADAIFPGMDRAARAEGVGGLFAAMPGCPPLLGVSRSGEDFSHCKAFNDAVINFLRARHDLRTVILVSRWALFETGRRLPGGGDSGPPVLLSDDRHPSAGASTEGVVFKLGLQRTIDAVVATGRRVIIVGDTPEIGWNVPLHLYLHARWGDPLPAVPTLHDLERRSRAVVAAFRSLAKRPNVRVVRLIPLLCKGGCPITHEGRAVYWDDDHISAFASRELLAPILAARVLKSVVPRAACRPRHLPAAFAADVSSSADSRC
jgi:peptidoglycan/LPS O-acetylase OafA/YrhL